VRVRAILMTWTGRRDGTLKKSYSFDVLADRVCLEPGCDKRIKQRLVESKDARFCYKHEPKRNISGHSKRSR
jgi:hypothetical protein